MVRDSPDRTGTPPAWRRRLAAVGLLAPGGALASLSAYAMLGSFESQCTTQFGTRAPGQHASCAGSGTELALVAFPVAVVCLVLGVAVLRAAPWSRWPAILVGVILATISAAATLAGVVALAGDSGDVGGAILLAFGGAALSAVSAMPAVLLGGETGRAVFDRAE